MKFVDRSNEIAALEREYQRDGVSMVILYGRRRVGKTELIRHFMSGELATLLSGRYVELILSILVDTLNSYKEDSYAAIGRAA